MRNPGERCHSSKRPRSDSSLRRSRPWIRDRATASWLFSFASQLTLAELSNAPADVIQNLRNIYNEVLSAYNENRGRSAPVLLNATGSLTLPPAANAYTKPLLVLVDEFSASGADMFPAIIQDNQRGQSFGMRTMGAGGSVVGFNATAYTESFFRVTVSLMNRGQLVKAPGLPAALSKTSACAPTWSRTL